MKNKYTEAQEKAITTLDKSVLVSAAAGAGKTTVLINRIIGIILEGKANVDEMLVVTFTNAAAAEMRLRLASAIRKRMREHPEDASKMKEQLSRLHRSYISTIDSFAQRVVKEFFYEIDMEPEFSVCDEVQGELMKREAAAELLEEAFEADNLIEGGSFREFMRLYSDERSDETFMTNLIKSYDSLRTMPDYFEWAYNKAEELKLNADTFKGTQLCEAVLADAKAVFETASGGCRVIRTMMDDAGLSDLFERKLSDECNAINDIYSLLDDKGIDEAFFAAADNIEYGKLNTKKDEKEAYEPIKGEVKAIRDAYKKSISNFTSRYTNPDLDTCFKEMNETYRYTIYYLKLLEEFERRYMLKKSEKRLMDFSDITHAAARILKKDEAAETMRKRFRFVFVDEYQDTNNLQEYLISKVSRPRNVFKVGDVKQSIYKFRLAEPEIFERLEREYADPSNEDGELINLSKNFRTNDATINYINNVFENIMEGYNDETKLYTGVECPEEYDFKPEVHVLLKDEEDEEVDEEIEELSSSEAESVYIADLAAGIVGTEFYDTKRNIVRKAEARDIAILLHSVKKSGDQIAARLAEKSVDAHIEAADDYFDTLEINIALSLFMCIDNFKRDVPLIATLHSEIFSFTPDELAAIRIAHREETDSYRAPFNEAFSWYVGSGPDGELREKACKAYTQIVEWRKQSRILPLSDFIWKVLTESGYYRAAASMNAGSRRQANLKSLADRAADFSRDNIASLSSFINFVEVMKSKKLSNGQPPMAGKEDNLVRISTMHKSKGLEFPFVIVGGLGRKFIRDNREKKFTFDSSVGVGLPYVEPGRRYWRSTIIQNAIKQKADMDSYKEDLRLLYVDMTRARNKLYLVGAAKDMESLMQYGNPNCYLKVLKDFIKTPYNEYYIKYLPKTAEEKDSKKGGKLWDKDIPLGAAGEAYYEEIDRRLKYEYPYAGSLREKTKYSVSAIRREELRSAAEESGGVPEDSEIVLLHEIGKRKRKASAADIGIAYHRIMEFIDFEKAAPGGKVDSAYIRERAEYLRDKNAIEENVFREIDLDNIGAFFETEIGKRALEASQTGKLYKEKAFTLKTERGGREILVQGVIDCCFEENGGMTLIDYKSSYIRKDRSHEEELERIRNEYRIQLELYSEAVKKGTGLEVNAAYLYLFTTGEYIKVRHQKDDITIHLQ